MYRNIINLTSVLALFAGVAGYPTIVHAHEGDKPCNVLLDGDGEPVKSSDDDAIAHSNSHSCGSHDASSGDDQSAAATAPVAAVEVEETVEESVDAAAQPVAVDPMTVYFDTGEDQLSAGAKQQVRSFAEQLFATNPKSVSVVGYTDTSGSPALNEKLSKARASNVMASLVEAGIASEIIEQAGAGEEALAVATPDGTREADNRRVVVTPIY